MVKDAVKRAVIAGASYALKYKQENERATDSEAISYVTKNIRKIIEDIEDND